MKYNPKPQIATVERLANPELKEEYEMPTNYQERVKLMVKLIEERDKLANIIPKMSPEEYRIAKPQFDEANKIVEDLEEKLAYEYECYQEKQRLEQELSELIEWQEVMSEEHFIYVKHKKPYLFKEFEKIVTAEMTDEEREEHYANIARREAEQLDDVLSGKIPAPEYHNPFIHIFLPKFQLPDIQLNIISLSYKTDNYFKEMHANIKKLESLRFDAVFELPRLLPVVRKNVEKNIREMREKTHFARLALLEYFSKNRESKKFAVIESPNYAELESLYKQRQSAEERLFIVAKHTEPENYERVKEMLLSDYETPKEIEVFFGRIAEAEKKWLNALLSAIADQ